MKRRTFLTSVTATVGSLLGLSTLKPSVASNNIDPIVEPLAPHRQIVFVRGVDGMFEHLPVLLYCRNRWHLSGTVMRNYPSPKSTMSLNEAFDNAEHIVNDTLDKPYPYSVIGVAFPTDSPDEYIIQVQPTKITRDSVVSTDDRHLLSSVFRIHMQRCGIDLLYACSWDEDRVRFIHSIHNSRFRSLYAYNWHAAENAVCLLPQREIIKTNVFDYFRSNCAVRWDEITFPTYTLDSI